MLFRSPPIPAPIPVPPVKINIFCVIIDDLGHNRAAAAPFLELDQPVALAFLPMRPHSRELAREAHETGKTVLLHLPMEPVGYPTVDPGKGAILVSFLPDEIERTITNDLEEFPFAAGINNHMGSKATSDERTMLAVLNVIKKKGLFFIDSRTSADTVAYKLAKGMKMSTGERDVFLDNERTPEDIDIQAGKLLDRAEERGWAIGIGHPYPETADALRRLAEEARRRGIRWGTVEEVLARADSGN